MGEHWYHKDGTPCFKVLNQAQTKKQGKNIFKDTTLREARFLKLLPSVTMITGQLDKPQLVDWKIYQAMDAFYNLSDNDRLMIYRDGGGSLKDEKGNEKGKQAVMKTVLARSKHYTEAAANFGTSVHNAIEKWLIDGEYPEDLDPKITPYIDKLSQFLDEEIDELISVEKVIVGDGYAGKFDLKAKMKDGRIGIIDFKTRKRTNRSANRPFDLHNEDGIQLAAYSDADQWSSDQPSEFIASLLIDRDKPSHPHLHEWSPEEHCKFFKTFDNLKNIWYLLKDYDLAA